MQLMYFAGIPYRSLIVFPLNDHPLVQCAEWWFEFQIMATNYIYQQYVVWWFNRIYIWSEFERVENSLTHSTQP